MGKNFYTMRQVGSQSRFLLQCRRGVGMLLEVVIGLGLFSVAVLLVFGVFASSRRAAAQSRSYTLATHLCRENLEREAAKNYPSVVTVAPIPTPVTFTSNGQPITQEFSVELLVNEEVANQRKEVRSRVLWQEGQLQRQVELRTYVVQF